MEAAQRKVLGQKPIAELLNFHFKALSLVAFPDLTFFWPIKSVHKISLASVFAISS